MNKNRTDLSSSEQEIDNIQNELFEKSSTKLIIHRNYGKNDYETFETKGIRFTEKSKMYVDFLNLGGVGVNDIVEDSLMNKWKIVDILHVSCFHRCTLKKIKTV